MTEQLPISIQLSNDLITQFPKVKSVCNKLEAQFNFQTLTASWYGDEDNILLINLYLETSDFFDLEKAKDRSGEISNFADDVFCIYHKELPQINCFIAIASKNSFAIKIVGNFSICFRSEIQVTLSLSNLFF